MSIEAFNCYKDLDKEFWLNRAEKEAKLIYSKPGPRRGRSLEEIIKTTAFGHAAECWLMKKYNFKDDLRPYKDLIYENVPVEVKAVNHVGNVPYMLQTCVDYKLEKWRKFPDIVYMFIGNKSSGDYHFHKAYKWNATAFQGITRGGLFV
tara:strand:+ start:1054 stop:1500 length:447 start_codon:yes stop_codon:yes gene_type:complete